MSSFDPGSDPATTALVLELTEEVTLPPASWIPREASSRVRLSSVPVRTKVFPAKGPVVFARRGARASGFTPARFNRFTKSRPDAEEKNRATLAAISGPIMSTSRSEASSASINASREPK